MADPGPTHYRIASLNRAFALASIAFLVSIVWAMIDDWSREWKRWQRAYHREEAARAEAALARVETPEFTERLTALNRDLAAARAALDARKDEVESLRKAFDEAKGREYAADLTLKQVRAKQQELLWEVGQERVDRDDLRWREGDLREKAAEAGAARRAWEEAKARREEAERTHGEAIAARTHAEGALDEIKRRRAPMVAAIDRVRPRKTSGKLLRAIRDFPGLDFLAPSLRVEKVVLSDLWIDLNFPGTRKRRVDMCHTCHLPIEKPEFSAPDPEHPEWTGGRSPLKAHPRLDLFVTSQSPHPLERTGCTVCHRGNGEALAFVNADHAPSDAAERARWESERHWHKMHHWDFPMLPLPFVEAGCLQCHQGSLDLLREEAPTLFRGYELVERYGCNTCHKLAWFPPPRKPGPPLSRIASKTTPAWAAPWIANPKSFRPRTPMPRIFHLENTLGRSYDDTAVAAVTAYLFAVSPEEHPAPPPGDGERGKGLFVKKGCLACHALEGIEGAGHAFADFGPRLDGIGAKVKPGWLYRWLLDPRAMWPDTKMPDFALTDAEAADVTAFLMTLTALPPGFAPGVPEADPAVLRGQARDFLASQFSLAEAENRLAALATEGEGRLLQFVGEKWVERQGCFACHDIAGKETMSPIGTELTEWGTKVFEQIDFGFLWREDIWARWKESRARRPDERPLPPTAAAWSALPLNRHDWLGQKLRAPRSFDFEKERDPLELFRMPQFDLPEEEIRALSTFVLGLVRDDIPLAEKHRPEPREKSLNDGWAAIRRNNCVGCHVFRMEEIAFRADETHAASGLASPGDELVVRGRTTFRDEEEGLVFFEPWEPVPEIPEPPVVVPEASIVSHRPFVGGGILPALAAWYLVEKDWDEMLAREKARPLSPPFLVGEGFKVQSPWLFSFLKKPAILRPWLEVRMPDFALSDEEARSIAEYFAAIEDREYGRAYSRRLRASLGLSVAAAARGANPGNPEGASRQIRALESKERGFGDAFERLRKFGEAQGFATDPPPALPFEHVREREESYFESRRADCIEPALRLAESKDVNCFSCHFRAGKAPEGDDPAGWAPDLIRAPERLRPDFVRRWIEDPQPLYPGTGMPTLFPKGDERYQDQWPAPRETQVECLKDLVMNLDRMGATSP